jgi:hypothetical protein
LLIFKSVSGQLTLDAKEKSIAGSALLVGGVKTQFTIKMMRKNMSFAVKLNDMGAIFKYSKTITNYLSV